MEDESLSLTRKLQLKELEILKVFQDICTRHNLRYFAIGGTCLGAVRHKGFIPWDDDVDFGMPYEDYIQFMKIAENELPENYGLLTHMNSAHHDCHYFSKIYDKNTAFIENGIESYHDRYCGVWVDIFPIHGAPKSRAAYNFITALCYLLKKLNNSLRFPFSDRLNIRNNIEKTLWIFASPLKLILPYYYFTQKEANLSGRYKFGCSDRVIFPFRAIKRNPHGWYPRVFYYSDFSRTIDFPFEDTVIPVPCGYDRYLSMEFNGDYMQLPPEEKRHSHHDEDTIIDLERSYKYYIEHPEAMHSKRNA